MSRILSVLCLLLMSSIIMAQPIQYTWMYEGKAYSVDLNFLKTHYRHYQAQSKQQSYEEYMDELSNRPYQLRLAILLDSLSEIAGCHTNLEKASFLLTFAQQAIEYRSDKTISPYNYPKYAIETLVEGWGDCEDKAILCATLFRTFGFNPVLLKYPSHVAAGLQCIDCPGHIKVAHQQFAYVESTGRGWEIGEIPDAYQGLSPKVMQLGKGVILER